MTKLTYAQQIKADRRAAAAERRQDDYRQDAGRVTAYKHVKTEVKPVKTRQAAILRRLAGRLDNLETLGRGYNDACLFILQGLAALFTNDQLAAMGQGQNSVIRHLDRVVAEGLGLEWTIFTGLDLADDDQVKITTDFGALFINDEDVDFAKEFINQVVADYKAGN